MAKENNVKVAPAVTPVVTKVPVPASKSAPAPLIKAAKAPVRVAPKKPFIVEEKSAAPAKPAPAKAAVTKPAPAKKAPVKAAAVQTAAVKAISVVKPVMQKVAFTPKPRPASSGTHLVQLGAFSSAEGAKRAWKILSTKNTDLAAFQYALTDQGPG